MSTTQRWLQGLFLCGFLLLPGSLSAQQKISNNDLGRDRIILKDVYNDVKKNYYDPTFHGLDWDASYKDADEEMQKAQSNAEAFSIIADLLNKFNDSHLYFVPPQRAFRVDYGYRLDMVGDQCFVIRTRPDTEAENLLHPGDQVVSLNNFPVNRDTLPKLMYYYNSLAPQLGTVLIVREAGGSQRRVDVKAKVQQLKKVVDLTSDADFWQTFRESEKADHVNRHRWSEIGDVMFWKMPEFDLDIQETDRIFGIAQKHKVLVMDLRGNPGGSVDTLEAVLGHLMDHDVKIADRVGQKKGMKPQEAKARKGRVFAGRLIVLVDSESASAAEILARVVQLEHRGTVLGDRTSGSVMEARQFAESQGIDVKVFYGLSVTDADLIMADGKSLEHTGVMPDEVILPTVADLVEGRDPALTRAAELGDLKLDPSEAGKMFPYEWQPF